LFWIALKDRWPFASMATTCSQQRAETPPPRRRAVADTEGQAAQQQLWSAKPEVNEGDGWTGSPLPRPRDTFIVKDDKFSTPKSKTGIGSDCLLPAKVNEDSCFSSPKCARGGEDDLLSSPTPRSAAGKENWQPGVPLARLPHTPAKTPSRLPTVKEDDGQMPPLDEQTESMPAWVVRTPQPADTDHGSDGVKCSLENARVKSTFISFVSPLKTFSLLSPPKTDPWNFAPKASFTSALFDDRADEARLQRQPWHSMSDSPMPWSPSEQVPFFPAQSTSTAFEKNEPEPAAGESRQKGPVVRLAEFLPEPTGAPPYQPAPLDQGYWSLPTMPSVPMQGMGIDFSSSFGTGLEGMTSTGSFGMPDVMQMQSNWSSPQQLQTDGSQMQPMLSQTEQLQQMPSAPQEMHFQMQQLHHEQLLQPQMDAQMQPTQMPQAQGQQVPLDQATLQLMHSQLQQLQSQMQVQTSSLQMPTQLMQYPQAQLAQMQPSQFQLPQMQPPQIPPPQMQAPQLQPPEMQPPQTQAPQLTMEAEQMLMQQFMQFQMQPPTWPPLQAPPPTMPAEHMLSAAAAPSALCPTACHQMGICRCGEIKVGETGPSMSLDTSCAADDPQMTTNNQEFSPNTCILLSAAMFPAMGATSNACTNRQSQ